MKKLLTALALLCFSVLLASCNNVSLHSKQKNLSSYQLNITFLEEEKKLEVTQNLDYVNSSSQVFETLSLHLYPTAFREGATASVVSLGSHSQAYYNGTSYGDIEILKVFDSKNNNMEYIIEGQDENILTVKLSKKIYPKERVKLNFEFEVILPEINHRFGIGKNTINLANFFPVACVYDEGSGFMTKPYSSNGDPFYSEMANFSVSVNYPSNYVIASTGKQLSTQENEFTKTTNINALVVRDFALVLSTNFSILEEKYEKTTVYYYYYEDEFALKSLETSVLALKTFSKTFGEYPYETLSVVKTSFVHGGMEYPNLVYIADNLSNYVDYTNVIVHEIAHQWWYNMVGSNAYDYPWLDEGLTDYSTALFYELNPQYEIRIDDIMINAMSTYSYYVEIYTAVYKSVDTSMNRSLNEYVNEKEYVYIAYVKGMLLFDALRNLTGDKNFFKALSLYFETHKFSNVTPYDLLACFEKTTGKDLEGFFDSWINGKLVVIPNRAVV